MSLLNGRLCCSIHFIAGILAVKESIFILALFIELDHELFLLLKLIVREEYVECLFLLEGEALADHLAELLEGEVKRDQVPFKAQLIRIGLTWSARGRAAFAQCSISQ